MNKNDLPNPMTVYPIKGYKKEIFIKPTVNNPHISVGDYSYIADSDFESHVSYLYDWNNDKLIIGKFCQIGSGVEFIMNGANHQMNSVSTYPFFTIEGFGAETPAPENMPLKGDTIVGNDVWIGQNATILPGVNIGHGAIIGANSVVGTDVEPYTIVAGNPAKQIRKRFTVELTELLLKWKWWDKPIEKITEIIPILTSKDTATVKEKIIEDLNKNRH
ncbi:MAG: CatB-related O-acetyltransferase [Clostridia bacterium]|nr:CatB-related O-acetyltransferase [Clostridia bacterium]